MPVVYPRPRSFILSRTPVATAVLLALGSPSVHAQQDTTVLGEVIVTSQKRSENLQDVPISVENLSAETLDELNIQNMKNYVQYLPSVSQQSGLGTVPGFNLIYMRGVATGGDGQAITSQPSVGTYLDEQPITTVQGNLDVHLYDIARVEALAGPQGTLFGASSQAGTIRIITNKPDASGVAAGYSLEGNLVDGDDSGYVAEGFLNIPLSDNAAVRLVGWATEDAGYIDNVHATRTWAGDPTDPADDVTADNSQFVEKNYNWNRTLGARAALKIDLGENWTVTPNFMWQRQDTHGTWGDDRNDVLAAGKNKAAHFSPEFTDDEWWQAGATVEGSIGMFDVVYSGNYLTRDVEASFDYSDYSYFYDNGPYSNTFANLFKDNDGNFIPRVQSFTNDDHYNKTSHELRITTPQDKRVRGLLGFFHQKQYHDFYEEFGNMPGLADNMMPNFLEPNSQHWEGLVYLNSMDRTDTDDAVFGQIQFDLTDTVELSLGARFFENETRVKGFFGYGLGFLQSRPPSQDNSNDIQPFEPGDPAVGGSDTYLPTGHGWSRNGEWRCPSQEDRKDAPCVNADRVNKESDSVYRVNLNWKVTDTALLYATWSEGYRPGGINRNPSVPDYASDFLTNYELGWKTRWADDRLQFNGAVFMEDWGSVQVAFQGLNGITQVENGPDAQILGTEMQLDWLATDNLRLSISAAYYDSELIDEYIAICSGLPCTKAPQGTSLPITGKFKGNLVARYHFPLGGFEAFTQGALAYEGSRSSSLNVGDNDIVGDVPANTFLDLSFGVQKEKYTIELFVANATDEDAPLGLTTECDATQCGSQTYGVQPRPRTFGIRFSQDF